VTSDDDQLLRKAWMDFCDELKRAIDSTPDSFGVD